MSKMRTKIFGVIVTFVVFLMAAVLSLSLPAAHSSAKVPAFVRVQVPSLEVA